MNMVQVGAVIVKINYYSASFFCYSYNFNFY